MKIILLLVTPLFLFGTVLIDNRPLYLITLFILIILVNLKIKKDRTLFILINSIFLLLFLSIIIYDPLKKYKNYYPLNKGSYSMIKSVSNSLKIFKLDNARYPSEKEGLEALLTNPDPKKYPNYAFSNYVNKVPLDAWKNPFIYIHYKTAERDAFQLISFGADERYGGEGEDADIVYPPLVEKKLGFFEWLF